MATPNKGYVNKANKFALDSKLTIAMIYNINIKES